jgi:hypothetical protein
LKAAAGHTAPPNGRSLREVAADLVDETRRLDLLNRDGANVRALFDSEYTGLTPNEQKALTFLALLEAETFVPWVLVPLLGGVFGMGEADNLMARLGAAHMVDVADRAASGAVRYRFHPLVRLYAREFAEPVKPYERQAALVRVDEAYRGVAAEVLRRLDAVADAGPPGRWLPPVEVLEAIARAPDRWARREQQHLVRCIDSATDRWELRWRVAARLGAFVPRGVDVGRTVAALDAVLAAAAGRGAQEAALRVGLARASLLIALERYDEADAGIELVVAAATRRGLPELVTTARRRQAEGRLQMGAYDATRHHLELADEAAVGAGGGTDGWEALRIAQLRVVCLTHREPEHWHDRLAEEEPTRDDSSSFYRTLASSEYARRAGDYDTADRLLLDLHREHRVDLRRCATVEYWRGRLWLTRARLAGVPAYAERAAGYAAEALLSFREMANRLGEVRAGCLLVRALGSAGRPVEAREQARLATELLAGIDASSAVELVRARLFRARAELLLQGATSRIPVQRRPGWTARADAAARGDLADEAAKLLTPALAVFQEHHDWWSTAECELLLGRASRIAGRPAVAVGLLYTAADAFNRARDEVHKTLALHEMKEAARAMKRLGPPRPLPEKP